MHFKASMIVCLLLISFFTFAITSSSFGIRSAHLIYLDWKCKINFNYTLLLEDVEHSASREEYLSCYNNTIDRMDRDNLTLNERLDCFLKCSQIANAELDEVGENLHPNATNFIKVKYEKYSDASPNYIKKVANLIEKCAKQAKQDIEQSKKNGTKTGECEINGQYEECWWESLDEYRVPDEKRINQLCLISE